MKCYVREISTGKSVKEIDFGNFVSRTNFDKFQRGILHNMSDKYYLDSTEVDAYLDKKESSPDGR